MRKRSVILLVISIVFSLTLFSFFAVPIHAQLNEATGINVNLGVEGCNNNGICELGETPLICPVDCAAITPTPTTTPPGPGGGGGGSTGSGSGEDLYIFNILVDPSFTSANVYWTSSVSTISTIKWGETTEVKEGILHNVIFARDHKMEIINLKPGTLYFFTIESQSVSGKIIVHPPVYFFTKFFKDTAFPSNPLNVKALADIPGINITWQNPPDENFSYVRIVRHEDRFRSDPFSGKLVYQGWGEKLLDKDVIAGKKYFYVLFARDDLGNFSSGVGVSETAYSPQKTSTTTNEIPPEVALSETFFVHQYNQQVEPLTSFKSVAIDANINTVVDTGSQTRPDDWMQVTNQEGKVVGQYLFSFNKDSGRYQSVIPPLENIGMYNIEIFRYKDNGTPVIISQGSLLIREKGSFPGHKLFNISYLNLLWIIILFIILLLILFFWRRRQKNPSK